MSRVVVIRKSIVLLVSAGLLSAGCATFTPPPSAPSQLGTPQVQPPWTQSRNYRPENREKANKGRPSAKKLPRKALPLPRRSEEQSKNGKKRDEIPVPKDARTPFDLETLQGLETSPDRSKAVGPAIIPQNVIVPAKLELEVLVAERKQVGSGVTFRLVIRNAGDEAADDVAIDSEFGEALVFPGQRDKKVRQNLGRLTPGETKEVALTLVSDEIGRHHCRFTVTSQDVESVWKTVFVEFLPKRLDIEIVGPSSRTLGSRAELTVKLANTSSESIDDVRVILTHDAALAPKEATTAAVQEGDTLNWQLETLRAGEGVQLQVEFECSVPARRACVLVTVTGRNIPEEQAEICLEVVPVEGILDIQIDDRGDPVKVGEETEYRISVTNRGLQAARQIQLTAVVPSRLRVLSARVLEGERQLNVDFNVQGQELVFDTIPSLAADGRLSFSVHAKALQAGDAEFCVQLTHDARVKPVEIREMTTINP